MPKPHDESGPHTGPASGPHSGPGSHAGPSSHAGPGSHHGSGSHPRPPSSSGVPSPGSGIFGNGSYTGGLSLDALRAAAGMDRLPNIPGYQILGELGKGGMGVVYKARQMSLNRVVAVKVIRGFAGWDDRLRFVHESEIVAELQHPHIVHLYEVGAADDAPFFSMEYVDGGTLATRFGGRARPPLEAANLVGVLARTVHFAHERGIVHRDLKPANVLFTADGCPKLTDFGVAKRMTDHLALTATGAVMGTLHYMSPEQAKGTKQVGPGVDIYALGCILYELLAGRTPFVEGESQVHMCQRVLTEEPISPAFHRPSIPRELEAVCMKCLQKDPAKRYPTAEALAEDLRRFVAGEAVSVRPPGPVRRTVKWAKRRPRTTAAILAATAIAGLAVSGLWVWRDLNLARQRQDESAVAARELHAIQYEREHVGYYQGFSGFRWGVLHGTGPLTPEQVSHRYRTYRVRRQGRLGPVVGCDVVNGHGVVVGTDASLKSTWLQGIATAPTGPVTCRIAYAADAAGLLTEETGYDRLGDVTYRLMYAYKREAAEPRAQVAGRYANPDGFEMASPYGASFVRFTRDPQGRDEQVQVVDAKGQPTRNADGVYGIRFEYGPTGVLTRLTNLDQAGRPMANLFGVAMTDVEMEAGGQVRRLAYLDADGKPVAQRGSMLSGVASIRLDYDAHGNLTARSLFGPDGRPVVANGWWRESAKYNDRGDRVEIAYALPSGEPAAAFAGVARMTLEAHDARGNVTRQSLYDAAGKRVRVEEIDYDARDNPLAMRLFDADGKSPTVTRRITCDAKGRPVAMTSVGPDGKPKEEEDGYTKVDTAYAADGSVASRTYSGYSASRGFAAHRWEFDANGRLVERTYLDAAGKPVPGAPGVARLRFAYDERGNLTETTYRDAKGDPARNAEGYLSERTIYDESSGRVVGYLLVGFDGSKGFSTIRRTVDDRGLATEEVTLDAADKPVASANRYARVKYRYNTAGTQVEAWYFDADGAPIRAPGMISRITWSDDRRKARAWGHDGTEYFPTSETEWDGTNMRASAPLDRRGNPSPDAFGVARTTYERDAAGRETARAFWDAGGMPARGSGGFARIDTAYDAAGRAVERRGSGGDPAFGYVTAVERLDAQGRAVEVLRLGPDGQPSAGLDGASRLVNRFDAAGRAVETQLFAPDGKPVTGPNRYGKQTFEYAEDGTPKRSVLSGFDGSLGYAARRQTFDGRGLLAEVETLDAAGAPVDSTHGYARKVFDYNAAGRATDVRCYAASGRPVATELLVVEVVPAGQAAEIGLRPGDVLLRYDGHALSNHAQLTGRRVDEGLRDIEIAYRRDGREATAKVRPGPLGVLLEDRAANRS